MFLQASLKGIWIQLTTAVLCEHLFHVWVPAPEALSSGAWPSPSTLKLDDIEKCLLNSRSQLVMKSVSDRLRQLCSQCLYTITTESGWCRATGLHSLLRCLWVAGISLIQAGLFWAQLQAVGWSPSAPCVSEPSRASRASSFPERRARGQAQHTAHSQTFAPIKAANNPQTRPSPKHIPAARVPWQTCPLWGVKNGIQSFNV